MHLPYTTILTPINYESIPIKNSRFIANINHINSEQGAFAQLDNIKKTYHDARHHCWAYYLHESNMSRSSDDGEPSGSAGKPILAHLLGQNIFDVIIVVTRYFGGTKLGVGGLVRAYGGTASEALATAQFVTITPKKSCWLKYDYENTSNINTVLHRFAIEPTQTNFAKNIITQIDVPYSQIDQFSADIKSMTKGKVQALFAKPINYT